MMMIKRLPDPNIKVLLVFGVLDSSVYPALLEETDDGLVVEVELGVDVLGQGLAATLTGYLTATVSTDQVTDLSTQHQSVNKTEILNGRRKQTRNYCIKNHLLPFYVDFFYYESF